MDLAFEERFDADGRRELHALSGGQVVGYVTAVLKGNRVEDIWVDPELRRQGIATALWDEQWRREWGLSHSPTRTADGDSWVGAVARERDEPVPALERGTLVAHSEPADAGRHVTGRVDGPGQVTALRGTAVVGRVIWREVDAGATLNELHLDVEQPFHEIRNTANVLALGMRRSTPHLAGHLPSSHREVMDLYTQRSRPQLTSLAAASGAEQQITDLRSFFRDRWAERAKQLGRDQPKDLSGACIFATAFAQRALGSGEVRGNWHHVHLRLPSGQLVDLTDAAGVREQALEREELHRTHPNFPVSPHFVGPDVDPMMHDEQFLESDDFLDTWDSVQERAAEWAADWITLQRGQSVSR